MFWIVCRTFDPCSTDDIRCRTCISFQDAAAKTTTFTNIYNTRNKINDKYDLEYDLEYDLDYDLEYDLDYDLN